MAVGLTFRSGPAASAGEIAWIRTIRQSSNWERTTRKLRVSVRFRRSLQESKCLDINLAPHTGHPPSRKFHCLSSVTRLSDSHLTRGFASQPHDWFAFIGEGSYKNCFFGLGVEARLVPKSFASDSPINLRTSRPS